MVDRAFRLLMLVEGVTRPMAEQLYKLGYQAVRDIAEADVGQLNLITGAGLDGAKRMKANAQAIIAAGGPTLDDMPPPRTAEEIVAAEEAIPAPEPEPADAAPPPEELPKLPPEAQRMYQVHGVGTRTYEALRAAGYGTPESIDHEHDVAKLAESSKLGLRKARQLKDAVRALLAQEGVPAPAPARTQGGGEA